MSQPVEVVRLPPGLRVFVVAMWLAFAVFFAWLSWSHPSHNHWVWYVMSGIAFWCALYWLRAPAVVARADDAGLTYADARWGLLFVFGEGQAEWSDVVAVDTREQASRQGSYLRTRVVLRGEGGAGRRGFTIVSRDAGYLEFLRALREHTPHAAEAVAGLAAVADEADGGGAVEERGLGDDPERAEAELDRMAAKRVTALQILFAVLMAALLVAFLLHRR